MKIIRAKAAGFCFGVRRAYELARKASKSSAKVATLGELIHNPEVLEELNSRGVRAISAISKIREGVVVIRAHGISQKKLRELKKKKVKIVDASCPFVQKIHAEVKKFAAQKIPVVIVGQRRHPEMRAIVEDFPAVAVVQKISPKRFQKFAGQRVALLAQTTERRERFVAAAETLKKLGVRVLARDTICNATRARQNSATALAKKVEVVVVVGGRKSNNTRQLFDLILKITRAFWVESEREIRVEWFKNSLNVGITAGASTPESVVERVEKKIRELVKSQKSL